MSTSRFSRRTSTLLFSMAFSSPRLDAPPYLSKWWPWGREWPVDRLPWIDGQTQLGNDALLSTVPGPICKIQTTYLAVALAENTHLQLGSGNQRRQLQQQDLESKMASGWHTATAGAVSTQGMQAKCSKSSVEHLLEQFFWLVERRRARQQDRAPSLLDERYGGLGALRLQPAGGSITCDYEGNGVQCNRRTACRC